MRVALNRTTAKTEMPPETTLPKTFFDVPGNARCAVRLGIQSVTYSDSRDGFRICLGVPRNLP
ncbi:MAG TPA: hypothetical protein VF278_07430 [Pirellulales bacterium]